MTGETAGRPHSCPLRHLHGSWTFLNTATIKDFLSLEFCYSNTKYMKKSHS